MSEQLMKFIPETKPLSESEVSELTTGDTVLAYNQCSVMIFVIGRRSSDPRSWWAVGKSSSRDNFGVVRLSEDWDIYCLERGPGLEESFGNTIWVDGIKGVDCIMPVRAVCVPEKGWILEEPVYDQNGEHSVLSTSDITEWRPTVSLSEKK